MPSGLQTRLCRAFLVICFVKYCCKNYIYFLAIPRVTEVYNHSELFAEALLLCYLQAFCNALNICRYELSRYFLVVLMVVHSEDRSILDAVGY